MEPMTISQVSKSLGISTRMLRYYEKAGLIESRRKEGYAYRIYDENTVCRLRRILLLRKLRIPVRQIKIILQNPNAATAVEIFRKTSTNWTRKSPRFPPSVKFSAVLPTSLPTPRGFRCRACWKRTIFCWNPSNPLPLSALILRRIRLWKN